ncbi:MULTISPECIES: DUF1302 domain-containing protein [unclassified Pseudomonas]|uniref:DUF1302 domain-containing protein n=1 Tax=unclassified Pseudomonas TaxID=196821 RepID=UPI00072FC50B|nr:MULTISPECIES: DUF1302 domain-containing protein [unclassified Pseudomonas]KSW27325.1 glycine/betaine transmethylase [Pseudomonas sp. ADP]OBP10079.1 glycine/betaine transmethylase [Pseudomonas sp. EGD-AKN5]QOF83987.1 DUF1302 domain-containing protein [Pseudomonas sp. ADPe]
MNRRTCIERGWGNPSFWAPRRAGALMGLLPLLVAGSVQAVEFSFADNQVTGSLDSTLSYGAMWRVQGRGTENIDDINTDDGNRNFDKGLVSQVFKLTSDLSAKYRNYGLFMRGTAYYDTQIMDKRNDYLSTTDGVERPSQSYPDDDRFTQDTRHIAGRKAELLDAYLSGDWDVAEHPLTGRVGRQVLNWGESTFYRGGINTINPVDASRFHLPGSELKEVLVPVEALSFNLGLTDNLSMESYYQWKWKETRLDPVGTYFADTDLFADGGDVAYTTEDSPEFKQLLAGYPLVAGLGLLGNGPAGPNAYLNPNTGTFKVASIGKDLDARDSGEYGVAFRYIAEQLNSTEFGLYFVNYHAKEPQVAVDLRSYQGADIAALNGVLGPLGLGEAVPGLATLDLASNAQARRDYVEDIRMYGFSFNTTLGDASVAGELAYRPNMPISIAATNDLLGDLLTQGVLGLTNLYDANTPADQACAAVSGKQLCRGSLFQNYERAETYNASLTGIYNFGPHMTFDSVVGVAELAGEFIRGSSLEYTAWDGSKRRFVGAQDKSYVGGSDDGDQISRDSYGYTLLLSGTWNDVFAGVKLSPYVVYQDDFKGNSDRTGNFIEGRKAYTLGADATYLNTFQVGMQYTNYYGAGVNNSMRDRDNVSISAKYSF